MTDEQLMKLRNLVRFLATAKHEEEEKRKARVSVEEEIASLIPGPNKGQLTVDLGDGLRVTVERGFNYKADLDKVAHVFEDSTMPAPIKIKTTRELDPIGYEWYRSAEPGYFAEIAKHVTVTPKKTAVSVKGL